MPRDGYSHDHWKRELVRPFSRHEQEVLAAVVRREGAERPSIGGHDADTGHLLNERKMIVPTAINGYFSVTARPTAFGKLVAHAYEAVTICHAYPLDHEPPTLFKMDCPTCNGTGADKPDCWLCKGDRRIKAHAAYRHGYKKADLEDLENDGWCDCPACHGESCRTCEGNGTVHADYLWREAQRVLLSEDARNTGPFPEMRWSGDRWYPGFIDEDALLSLAAMDWLRLMNWSSGLYSNMFDQWFYLDAEAKDIAAAVLKPSETADLVRMWLAGEPWKPAKRSGQYHQHEREKFEEAAAFHRCRFRGWIAHDYRRRGYTWTVDGKKAIAGWEGDQIRLSRPRLKSPTRDLKDMERVSSARRAVWKAETAVIRSADRIEAAQARLDAAVDRGDHDEAARWRMHVTAERSDIFFGYDAQCRHLDRQRQELAWAHAAAEARHG
ncbi:hypothetical protein [Azospirillum himalayense]|uniref:Uncharacterized protein n=1 Tax=Azospirillum himalayense TaxID=654847 RepID=A0ABW0GF48_9PROT